MGNGQDAGMVAAILAMAAQLKNVSLRDRIVNAARGQEEQEKPVDVVRTLVLSGAEAARVLSVSRRTVLTWAKQGLIEKAAIRGRSRGFGYTRESVERLARNTATAGA